MKYKKFDNVPHFKDRFIMNRQLVKKAFDTIVISIYMLFLKDQAASGVKPVTGNYFVAHSVADLGLAYFSLFCGIFGLYVALSKHNMIKTKMYTYFLILFSWSSYLALFIYKWFALNGSLLSVIFIGLILMSILLEMLVGDWSDSN